MLKRAIYIFVVATVFALSGLAQAPQTVTDVVLVLPFENTSGKPEFNWVGESFADSLSELLGGRWQQPVVNGKANPRDDLFGFDAISNEERKIAQQKLNIPLSSVPSLATALKLARSMQVSKLVIGAFSITNTAVEKAEVPTVTANVKLIDVRTGTFDFEKNDKGEPLLDNNGKKQFKMMVITKPLIDLQSAQGEVAYLILLKQKILTTSLSQVSDFANKIPAKAFEAYIKGLLTAPSDVQNREIFFKNAIIKYAADEKTAGGVYSKAEVELGHLYLSQRKYPEAISHFSRIPIEDTEYAEAAFYSSLIFLQQGNYESALATLQPLADDLKLTSVYNILGAISVQESRAQKKNDSKAAALLNDGLIFLKKASDATPDDKNAKFNYAVTLFLSGNMQEAITYFKSLIAVSPLDGEAYFLLAKALKTVNGPLADEADNNARKYLTTNNRYATLESEWLKSKTVIAIPLRVENPARMDFVAVVLSSKQGKRPPKPLISETETLLGQARIQVKAGQDDDAMMTLRRVLASEPMSAESYLLLGIIHLRRGDKDQAISSFKTAIFWNSNLIDPYINLGKIFIDKEDCLQAKTYYAQAAVIDAENQEVQGLQRMVEKCSK